ncbi:MAG: aminopeptidase P family protein [Fusobacterium varium]|uniref:Aminopeptidase P family protein n=2 Tax=Fusobacterium varium TaxID=856 RepID=A0ABN5JGT1_FUSVA|nr:aminopeptidase P family protein [Fusobacterium varium]AVQ29949.1 aminopeptidase P family protein [Fusobacterium varium ATCC 27725]
MSNIRERIIKLRKLMKEKGIDVYVIPSSDYHQSEYVGEYFKTREFISGFTGSAGTVVVTENEAGLWTDGRYFIQAEKQLEGSSITLFKMGEENVPTFIEYISKNLKSGQCLGFDGKVLSVKNVFDIKNGFGKKEIKLEDRYDLVNEIWNDRPALPKSNVFILDEKYCGESFESKIKRIREKMSKLDANRHILTSLDDIAWLYNIRGRDIKNNPVSLAYTMISAEEVVLYIDKNKITEEAEKYFIDKNIKIKDYFSIYEEVKVISSEDKVLLDTNKVNYFIYNSIPRGTEIIDKPNPSTFMKACKNDIELENLKNAHIKDGVAVTKFMYWLKKNIGSQEMTEMSVAEKLESFRKEWTDYIEPSFNTISAYEANAAMMHYSANKDSNSQLAPRNLLLVDSGGQYIDGTTDITRTFVLGECSGEVKEHFTLVLKGMLSLSMIKFMYGVTGTNLDILARRPVWSRGIDYKCGTGHGVGFLLNVHEGPHSIRWQYNPQVLEAGMTVTNEPGVYIQGSHGIRLENELIVRNAEKTDFGQFMVFETMTYAPLDLDGVVSELLNEEEKEFLNNYHQMVFEKISPFLSEEEKKWLKEYTRKI